MIIRFGRSIGFGYQHIAVRKHEDPARVIQIIGKGGYG